jgi:hypothetical protein
MYAVEGSVQAALHIGNAIDGRLAIGLVLRRIRMISHVGISMIA